VEEREGDSEDTRFLPPEPAGPEPELSEPPAKQEPPPPPPPQQQQQQTYGYPPPPPGQPYYAPPPPPPPGYGQPPPQGYPAQGYPAQGYPPQWGYAQPPVPDNGQAVAGFVFSLVSLGLLVISAGLSSLVSVGCAIAGIILGRNGKRKVDTGKTPKHRGLAQAGFIVGWISLALSILATVAWTLVLAFAIADEDFDWDTDPDTVRVTALALVAAARIVGG
jgi:hypothetical protein